MKSYINFRNLDGNELDVDFKKWAIKNGFNENGSISVIKAQSISGHDVYLVDCFK